MARRKPPVDENGVKYTVLTRIEHNGFAFERGDVVSLADYEAEPLLEVAAIELVKEDGAKA